MRSHLAASPDRSAPRRAPWVRTAVVVSLTLAAVIPIVHFAVIFPMVRNFPSWDQWSLIPVWRSHFAGRPVLPLLLAPYNGHFNILPKLVFFGLGLVTRWDLRWEVVLSYLAALVTLGILLLMLRESGEGFLALAWVAALQVFSLGQFENYMSGYPFGQVLSQAAATLAVFSLTRREHPARRVGVAAGAAAIATLSWAAGSVVWPLGLAALAFRWPKRRVVIAWWSLGTVGAFALTWLAARLSGQAEQALTRLGGAAHFALALLGRQLAAEVFTTPAADVWLGVWLLLLFAGVLVGALLLGRRFLAFRWGLFGGLAIAAALLVGVGRARAGLQQALASHYVTAAYPLVLATVVLATGCAVELARRRGLVRWLAIVAGTVLLAAATVQPVEAATRIVRVLRIWHQQSDVAVARLVRGKSTDEEIRRFFHPNPALVRSGVTLMKKHRLACFARDVRGPRAGRPAG